MHQVMGVVSFGIYCKFTIKLTWHDNNVVFVYQFPGDYRENMFFLQIPNLRLHVISQLESRSLQLALIVVLVIGNVMMVA